jgi:hypothetical protein
MSRSVIARSPKPSTDDRTPYERIITLDLSDDEKLALIRLLTRTIEDDRYPLSPRIRTMKGILAKRAGARHR